jgi:hypothetical protein
VKAITHDTESEQPTDNELSESKTVSSSTSGQRTPTPETEAELENSEIIEEDSFAGTQISHVSVSSSLFLDSHLPYLSINLPGCFYKSLSINDENDEINFIT